MKHTIHLTAVVVALGLALHATAADQESRLYFTAEGGANVAPDIGLRGSSGSLELDTGTRFGGSVGYYVTRNISVEFNTGWLWNSLSDIDDSSLRRMPFVVNGIYNLQLGSKFEPYVGAGIGGVFSILQIDDAGVEDDDGDVTFGWQALAGIRYKFRENMSLGLGYKYLFNGENDFDIESSKVRLENGHNHSIGVVFNMSF